MRRLASVLKLDPGSVYLVKELENATVFPECHCISYFAASVASMTSSTLLSTIRKVKTFRKTLVLVSLSQSDRLASSSKAQVVEYSTVTQVVVYLEPNKCSTIVVADLFLWKVSAIQFSTMPPQGAMISGSRLKKYWLHLSRYSRNSVA